MNAKLKLSPAEKSARAMAAALAGIQLDNVFNPYADVCGVHDALNSPKIRLKNLEAYFSQAITFGPRTAWIGRDLGYRGGRRTGLPLTDEAHLPSFSSAFNVPSAKKATVTAPVAERTAAEIWRVIMSLDEPPFLWNAFPFHPHESDSPLNNRCHTKKEFQACEDLLAELMGMFNFERIYVLGNDAGRAMERLGLSFTYIRHPSYGGQTEFRRQMNVEYGERSGGQMLLI